MKFHLIFRPEIFTAHGGLFVYGDLTRICCEFLLCRHMTDFAIQCTICVNCPLMDFILQMIIECKYPCGYNEAKKRKWYKSG